MSTATKAKPRKTSTNSGVPPVGTVEIPARCKPSRVCNPDQTRPLLRHAYLRRREDGLWLCATDSYIAAAVKVEGDAEEGFIPVGALRFMEAGQRAEQLSDTAWRVHTGDGLLTFDISGQIAGSVNYPDFESLGMWDAPTEGARAKGEVPKVGINPSLMTRLAAGLGARHGCRFEFSAPLKVIHVTPLSEVDRHGLQMPIRLNV